MRPITQSWSELVVEELGNSGMELADVLKGASRFTEVILTKRRYYIYLAITH